MRRATDAAGRSEAAHAPSGTARRVHFSDAASPSGEEVRQGPSSALSRSSLPPPVTPGGHRDLAQEDPAASPARELQRPPDGQWNADPERAPYRPKGASRTASASSAGTSILDALLALVDPTPQPLATRAIRRESASEGPAVDPLGGMNNSAESAGSAEQADIEVSIEHVSVLSTTQPPVTGGPEVAPSPPPSVTSGSSPSASPASSSPLSSAPLQVAAPPPSRGVGSEGQRQHTRELTGAAGAAPEAVPPSASLQLRESASRMGDLSAPNTSHRAAAPPAMARTTILDSRDGSLQDPVALGDAWRSRFATNAQRLLRETQLQVQELLYYKEAYEAAVAAHEREQDRIQRLAAEIEAEKRGRAADKAAHERAMASLSAEALELSRELGALRAQLEHMKASLAAAQRERDEAVREKDALSSHADVVLQASAKEAAQLRQQLDSVARESTALEAERQRLESANVKWQSRLLQEQQRWRRNLQPRQDPSLVDGEHDAEAAHSSLMHLSGISAATDDSAAGEPLLTVQEQDSLLESIGATGVMPRTETERRLLRHIQLLTRERQQAVTVPQRLEPHPTGVDMENGARQREAESERLRRELESLRRERDDLAAALQAAKLHRETDESSLVSESEHSLTLSRQLRAARKRIADLQAAQRTHQQQLLTQQQEHEDTLAKERDAAAAAARQACAKRLHDVIQVSAAARPSSDMLNDSSAFSARLSAFLEQLGEESRPQEGGGATAEDFDGCLSALSELLSRLAEPEKKQHARASSEDRVTALESELQVARQTMAEFEKEKQAFAKAALDEQQKWISLAAILGKQHQLLQNAAREHAAAGRASRRRAGGAGEDESLATADTGDQTAEGSPLSASTALAPAPLLSTAVLSVGTAPTDVLQQAESSHQHLLTLLSATREVKAALQLARRKLKEAAHQHDAAMAQERLKAKELESRITNLTRDTRSAEARWREESAARQRKVQGRLNELVTLLDATEAESAQQQSQNAALARRAQAAEDAAERAAAALAEKEAELRELHDEHVTFTESLRDVVAERDDLLEHRQGLLEAARTMEQRSALDRENLLHLYALFTQWTRWTAWLMLQNDALQLQKQWHREVCSGANRELGRICALVRVRYPDLASRQRKQRAPRGCRRFRVLALAVLAAVSLQRARALRRQILAIKAFSSVSIAGATAVADPLAAEETARMLLGGASAPRSGSVPRVVFFAEDATENAAGFMEALEAHVEGDVALRGLDTAARSAAHVPFLSTLSLPATLQVTADRLRDRVVLPSTFLPPMHEMLTSLRRLFKLDTPAVQPLSSGTAAATPPSTRTADAYDLIEFTLHSLTSRVQKEANLPSTPVSQAMRYVTTRCNNRGMPRAGQMLMARAIADADGGVAGSAKFFLASNVTAQLEEILDEKDKRLREAEQHRTELEKDMDVLTSQNLELGRVLELKSEGQEAIARDLAALEDLVQARPTSEELQTLRERLLAVGVELQRERERRHAEEDKVAQHQVNEMALLRTQQQLKNEVRSLKIELGRAAAVNHNRHAALFDRERREWQGEARDIHHDALLPPPTAAPPTLSTIVGAGTQREQRRAAPSVHMSASNPRPTSPPLSPSVDSHQVRHGPYAFGQQQPLSNRPQEAFSALAQNTSRSSANPHAVSIVMDSPTSATPNASLELYEPMALRQRKRVSFHHASPHEAEKATSRVDGGSAEPLPLPAALPPPAGYRAPSSVSTTSHASSRAFAVAPEERASTLSSKDAAISHPSTSYVASRRSTLPKEPTPVGEWSDRMSDGDTREAAMSPATLEGRSVTSLHQGGSAHQKSRASTVSTITTTVSDAFSPSPRLGSQQPERSLQLDTNESHDAVQERYHRSGQTTTGRGAPTTARHPSSASASEEGRRSYDDRHVSINPPSSGMAGSNGSVNN